MIRKKKNLGLQLGLLSNWHGLNVVFSFAVDLETNITFPSIFQCVMSCLLLKRVGGKSCLLMCKIPPFYKIDVK